MKNNRALLGLMLLGTTFVAQASDPVSWSLSPSTGFAVTPVGDSSIVTYTLTSHLPFPTTIVTGSGYTGTGITAVDHCNNVKLAPSGHCTVVYTFTPTSNDQTSTVQLTYGYNNNRIPIPMLTASSAGLTGTITATPSSVTLSPVQTSTILATYTNNTSQPISVYAGDSSGTNLFNLDPSNAASITVNPNGCGTYSQPFNLEPTHSCSVQGTLTPLQLGNVGVTGLLTYAANGQPASTPSTSVQITQAAGPSVTGVITGLPSGLTITPLETPTITATYTNTGGVPVTGNAGDILGANIFTASSTDDGAATVGTAINNFCGTPGHLKTLQPTESCTVQAQITPTQIGTVTITGLFTYNTNLTSSPTASTTITQGTPGTCNVSGVAQLPLPAQSYQYENNMVEFVYTNNCQAGMGNDATLGTVTFSVTGGTATVTQDPATYDHCSGHTVPGQGSCSVLISVIPTTTSSNMTVTASVVAGTNPPSTASTNAPVSANTTGHTMHFINQCPFNVWYGISNAADGVGSPDPTPGSQSANGAPSSSYYLAAQVNQQRPSTIDLAISAYVNGAIWPRTNCASDGTNFVCATGFCDTVSANSGTCVSEGSFEQPRAPYTKLEFTIESAADVDGVYDVSVIGGMNVPVEIKGLGSTTQSSPFSCTSVGAVIQQEGYNLGNCPWTFNPAGSGLSNNDFYFVTTAANNDCTSPSAGNLCGMAYKNYPNGAPINRTNGAFLGYWSLNVFQGFPASGQWGSTTYNLYNKYDMGAAMSTLSSQDYGDVLGSPTNFGDLLICKPTTNGSLLTCYKNAASTCCGCYTWGDTASQLTCTTPNSDWTTTLPSAPVSGLQAITWLHAGCPTAYAYTFDDQSAGATTCNATNTYTSYEVTFCPGGQTGLPAGANEGRG